MHTCFVAEFPAFQNLILEPELLETIVSMITTDQESYVRATAMTCLSELVKVQELWENKLRSKQLTVSEVCSFCDFSCNLYINLYITCPCLCMYTL